MTSAPQRSGRNITTSAPRRPLENGRKPTGRNPRDSAYRRVTKVPRRSPCIPARSVRTTSARITVILAMMASSDVRAVIFGMNAMQLDRPLHLQKVTIATVPVVTPAKPAKLTIARNTREFSVRVPTVVGIIEGTNLWRIWATGTGSSSCGRCRGLSTIRWSSRGPPPIAGTLDVGTSSTPRTPPVIAGTLDVGIGPTTPTTSWRRSRYRGSASPALIADSGPQVPIGDGSRPRPPIPTHIPVGGNRNVPVCGGHPSHALAVNTTCQTVPEPSCFCCQPSPYRD